MGLPAEPEPDTPEPECKPQGIDLFKSLNYIPVSKLRPEWFEHSS